MKNDDTTNQPANKDRDAAANIIRGDLDRIYSGDDAPHAKAEQEIRAKQTTSKANENAAAEPGAHYDYREEWKNYHNSWSSYYQQYYERYYMNHLHRAKQTIEKPNPAQAAAPGQAGVIGS